MRISVALATYNGGPYLPEQLASLASQTVLPAELVVSDDGSSDNTIDIVGRFAENAPFPVRVLEKPHRLGFSDNFLHAAASCSHELVAFCDQDDVWLPRKLEVGLQRLQGDGSLLSLHSLTLTDESLHPIGQFDQGIAGDAVFNPLEIDPYFTGWGNTMMFRRKLATLIPRERRPNQPGLERPLSHDTWIYVLAAALGRVSHIAEPLILYRQHSTSVFGVEPPTLVERIRSICADPSEGFWQKVAFDREISLLFRGLARESTNGLEQRAREAAERFAQRSVHLQKRIALYRGHSVAARISAYVSMLRSLREDHAAARRAPQALAKDFFFGVLGISRYVPRSRRRRDG